MQIDYSALGPLAQAVELAGAPILGEVLRAAAPVVGAAVPIPFAGPIITMVLNELANDLGPPANDPTALAQKIAADPDAAGKIQAFEEKYKADLQNALDIAKVQADQNTAALNANLPLWAKIYFAGARPLQMWLTGPLLTLYQYGVTFGHLPPMDPTTFAGLAGQFVILSGARSVEKVQGVASPMPVVPTPIKRLLTRKAAR